jgi:hypothetical protein
LGEQLAVKTAVTFPGPWNSGFPNASFRQETGS